MMAVTSNEICAKLCAGIEKLLNKVTPRVNFGLV